MTVKVFGYLILARFLGFYFFTLALQTVACMEQPRAGVAYNASLTLCYRRVEENFFVALLTFWEGSCSAGSFFKFASFY